VTRDRYVKGLEFHPGSAAVHHANIKLDVTGSSRRLDADDAQPGFEGSGRDAHFPDGQFLGWTPGQRPLVSENEAWLLPAGADLVVELHLTSTGKPERIQPRVALQFTAHAPRRTPYMLRLSNQRLDIAADARHHVSTDEYILPVAVEVMAVQPHAHNLARSVTGFAYLPDGRREWLIDIPDWDFRWQDVYRYEVPLQLPKGTRLEMRYTYDNSADNPRNPHRPPRRVTFGQTSDAEMGDLWLQVAAADAGDRARLAADADRKMLKEDTAGDEMVAWSRPHDARIRRDLASCYNALGRPADAREQLERAVTLEPDSADGQFQLGTLLLEQRRLPAAVESLRRAIAIAPAWSESYNNLGAALFLEGDLSGASQAFDEALRRDPHSASAWFNRGRLLAAGGRGAEALAAFKTSLQIRPEDAETLMAAASTSAAVDSATDAVDFYRHALRRNPDLVPALVDLAWILAGAEPHRPEWAEEAVRLAERAAQLAGDNPAVLDTLAASYFAAGRVDDAVGAAERGLGAAEVRGDARAVRDLGGRLRQYRAAREH
jgi:tetratricopeptide (TPR) repeat protein